MTKRNILQVAGEESEVSRFLDYFKINRAMIDIDEEWDWSNKSDDQHSEFIDRIWEDTETRIDCIRLERVPKLTAVTSGIEISFDTHGLMWGAMFHAHWMAQNYTDLKFVLILSEDFCTTLVASFERGHWSLVKEDSSPRLFSLGEGDDVHFTPEVLEQAYRQEGKAIDFDWRHFRPNPLPSHLRSYEDNRSDTDSMAEADAFIEELKRMANEEESNKQKMKEMKRKAK